MSGSSASERGDQVNRRTALKKAGAGIAVAWAAPAIWSAPAFAQGSVLLIDPFTANTAAIDAPPTDSTTTSDASILGTNRFLEVTNTGALVGTTASATGGQLLTQNDVATENGGVVLRYGDGNNPPAFLVDSGGFTNLAIDVDTATNAQASVFLVDTAGNSANVVYSPLAAGANSQALSNWAGVDLNNIGRILIILTRVGGGNGTWDATLDSIEFT